MNVSRTTQAQVQEVEKNSRSKKKKGEDEEKVAGKPSSTKTAAPSAAATITNPKDKVELSNTAKPSAPSPSSEMTVEKAESLIDQMESGKLVGAEKEKASQQVKEFFKRYKDNA